MMKIGDRTVDPMQPPYVIAELGVNHDGSVSRALELTEAARQVGADAIKLQWFNATQLLSRGALLATYQREAGAADPLSLLRSLQLDEDEMSSVVNLAHSLGLHAIVTVFSTALVDSASQLPWDAYKTASPDIINRPLIGALVALNKPLFLSTGAATLDEVQRALVWLEDRQHILMQCVSAYPTPDESASLAGRIALEAIDPAALGYSDHTMSIDAGALAVASGARVLEKHMTYDCSAIGPDHTASLEPERFKEYVDGAHRAYHMLGPVNKLVMPIEADVRNVARQSLTTTTALPAGHQLAASDIAIKRPGTGLPPFQLQDAIGRTLARAIEADTPICETDLS